MQQFSTHHAHDDDIHQRLPRGWLDCICQCGMAGDKELHVGLPPYATNAQIRIFLTAANHDFDPYFFNKIIVNGVVHDFTQKDMRVLPPENNNEGRRGGSEVLIQLIRDKDHPDFTPRS